MAAAPDSLPQLTAAHRFEIAPSVPRRQGPPPSHFYPIIPHPENKNFVDLDEDLQLKDFENAVKEGYDNIELLNATQRLVWDRARESIPT